MKFPSAFTRYLGTIPAGGKQLGTDALPSGRPVSNQDNLLISRFSNVNGWPVQRVAVTYSGPSGASNLTARMYFYEDSTGSWYQIGAQQTIVSGTVSFFDCVAILEMPNTLAKLQDATSGSLAQVLIVDAVGVVAGAYQFAMAPDLTSQA